MLLHLNSAMSWDRSKSLGIASISSLPSEVLLLTFHIALCSPTSPQVHMLYPEHGVPPKPSLDSALNRCVKQTESPSFLNKDSLL